MNAPAANESEQSPAHRIPGLPDAWLLRTHPPAHMSIAEAATYLTVSGMTIRRLVATRKLRAARIGRRVVVSRVELDRYVALCGTR